MKIRINTTVLLVVLLALKLGYDHSFEKQYGEPFPPITSLLYFPQGPTVEFLTLGFHQWTADFLYLWAIQYYSHYELHDRYKYLRHVFNLITDLDTRYIDAYRLAALLCAIEMHELESCALYFLDRGLDKNPRAWELAFDGAFYCQFFKREPQCSEKYLNLARKMPEAPPFITRWLAKILALKGDIDTSLAMWQELLEKGDSYTRKVAQIHVHDLSILVHARDLQRWIQSVQQRIGRYPQNLQQLRRYGYTGPILDLEGNPFQYNPTTGKVTPNPRSLYRYGGLLDKIRF